MAPGVVRRTQPPAAAPTHGPLPSQQQLAYFHEHLQRVMEGSGFINQPHARTSDHLHALFARAQPNRKELSLLRGLLSSLEAHLEPPSS